MWLITDLSQSKYISVLPVDRLFSILNKLDLLEARNYASEDLKNVVTEAGVEYIIQAQYSKAGDLFRIDHSLLKGNTLEVISTDFVSGNSEESFPSMIDKITEKTKSSLQLTDEQLAQDFDKETETITTSSPEAFRYYSLGMKYHLQLETQKARGLFEQAVAIDPEFAMAYRALAVTYSQNRKKRMQMLEKALELRDRVTEKEGLRIEAHFYQASGEQSYDKAIILYEKLLDWYPYEVGGRHNLAVLYNNIGEWHKAIDHLEICIKEYNHEFVWSYAILGIAYEALGAFDKANEAYQRYLNNFPDKRLLHIKLAHNYRYQDKYELGLEEVDKAFTFDPMNWNNFQHRGDIYYYMGDYAKAETEYRKLLEREERFANLAGLWRLSLLYMLQGKYKASIDQAQKRLELAEKHGLKIATRTSLGLLADMDRITGKPADALNKYDTILKSAVENEDLTHQRNFLPQKALTYLEMKQILEAQKIAENYKVLLESAPNKKLMSGYYHLLGMIEIEKGDYSKANEYLKMGLPLLNASTDQPLIFSDSLGRAYYLSEDLKKAQEEYKKLTSLNSNRLRYGDIYAKSFYILGKIYQQQGDTTKAINHYEKFLFLWKDADPGIAEVEDARKRLAGLKSN